MKISLSWLKEYIDLRLPPESIAQTLTLAGLEVDEIIVLTPSFTGVCFAKVLETVPHPNADRLKIAKVFDGQEEYQVVCGAPNCRPGIVTAFAKIGASLPDPEGKPWKIKKSKIRDIESYGMLCAADELGMPFENEGILELPLDSVLGSDLSLLYHDTIFDITLTPNLGHCMSVFGIARELSALLNLPLKKLSTSFTEPDSSSSFSISIKDSSLCPHYSCRLVSSVQIGPSPSFLARKLQSIGLKSINNVVDVSNYVMMLTGQPLHFFDADRLKGSTITVRPTLSSEKMVTLDQIPRDLPPNSLVICDESSIIALAGIMGSAHSAVSENTRNVLIEAALFAPSSIRKTCKALSFKTDASQRFEKGIDPCSLSFSLDLATSLLQEVAQGSCLEKKADSNARPFIPKKLICRQEKTNRLLGTHLSLGEISNLLKRLQITVIKEHSDFLEVLIPSYRNDLNEEIDLIEEIARLYGFNHLPKRSPLHYTPQLQDSPFFSFENRVRQLLLQEGLQEFMTCDLISPKLSEKTLEKMNPCLEALTVLQSKSNDYSVLRHSLLPGLVDLVKYNFDHENPHVAGFEVGRVHFKKEGKYQEPCSIGIILSGENTPHHHNPKPRPFDFFDLKGIIENLLEALHIEQTVFTESHLHHLQPGRQAYLQKDSMTIGAFGEVHPQLLSEFDLPKRVYFAELNLEALLRCFRPVSSTKDLPLYPSSTRDWTVSLKKESSIEEIRACILALAPSVLEEVFLLDLFQSEQIGQDRKNATWRFIYRDLKKTLDLSTVEDHHTKLLQMVAEKLHDCIL